VRGSGGLSPNTVHHVHAVLHRALRDAVKWGYLQINAVQAADPGRYQNADSSCRNRIVLVDQAAEEITPLDLWHDRHRIDGALLVRYSKRDAAVRSLGVVVTGVAREHMVEMAASKDQGPVQDLVTQCLHGPLGKGIGLR
jgi:hypothetical protein